MGFQCVIKVLLFNLMQIVSELPAGSNWNFDVHWYPRIPGLIAASSYDGKIGIHNIEVGVLIFLLNRCA